MAFELLEGLIRVRVAPGDLRRVRAQLNSLKRLAASIGPASVSAGGRGGPLNARVLPIVPPPILASQSNALRNLARTNLLTGEVAEATRRFRGFTSALSAARAAGASFSQVIGALASNLAGTGIAAALFAIAKGGLAVAKFAATKVFQAISFGARAAVGPVRELAGAFLFLIKNLPEALALGFAFSFKSLVDAQTEIERIRIGLSLGFGDRAAKQMQFLSDTASEFGLRIFDAGQLLSRLGVTLGASGIPEEEINQLFRGLTAAIAVTGRTRREQKLIINGLEDIAAKDSATAEDIKRQISQSLPVFKPLIAKAFPGLDDKAIAALSARQFFSGISTQALDDFAAAAQTAAQKTQGSINAILNRIDLLKVALAEVAVPQVLGKLQEAFKRFESAGAVSGIQNLFRNIANSVTVIVDRLSSPEAIRWFKAASEEVSNMLQSMVIFRGLVGGALVGAVRSLVQVLNVGFRRISDSLTAAFNITPIRNFDTALAFSITLFEDTAARFERTVNALVKANSLLFEVSGISKAIRAAEAFVGLTNAKFEQIAQFTGITKSEPFLERVNKNLKLINEERRKNLVLEQNARTAGFGLDKLGAAGAVASGATSGQAKILGLEGFFAQLQGGTVDAPTRATIEQQTRLIVGASARVEDAIERNTAAIEGVGVDVRSSGRDEVGRFNRGG